MTKKPKRVRVVEVEVYTFGSAMNFWDWHVRLSKASVSAHDYLPSRRAAIADARRWWAQFGVTVKIARKR